MIRPEEQTIINILVDESTESANQLIATTRYYSYEMQFLFKDFIPYFKCRRSGCSTWLKCVDGVYSKTGGSLDHNHEPETDELERIFEHATLLEAQDDESWKEDAPEIIISCDPELERVIRQQVKIRRPREHYHSRLLPVYWHILTL